MRKSIYKKQETIMEGENEDTRHKKQETNRERENKIFDFEERTLQFSKRILRLAKALPKDDVNIILIKQFVRSGTSIGANYREANDALGDKDFLNRLRIARKEAKETTYWLGLVKENNPQIESRMDAIIGESVELRKILSTMIIRREENLKKNKNS